MVSTIANGQKTTLFMGGIAHLGNGEKINNSIISIKDGKIDLALALDPIAKTLKYRGGYY